MYGWISAETSFAIHRDDPATTRFGDDKMTASDALRHSRIRLVNGQGSMPAVGFGTLIPDLAKTKDATKTALEVGFRHFDCAERYRNEEAVGDAMRETFEAGRVQRGEGF